MKESHDDKKKYSLRTAINLKCKDCIYDPELPYGWKQQVSLCELTDCSLWKYRPKSRTSPVSSKMTSPACHFQSNGVEVGSSL